MFDQILNIVKEQISNNPQIASVIPAQFKDAIPGEIASSVEEGVKAQASEGVGGLLSMLGSGGGISGGLVSTITTTVVNNLTAKFGLSPAIANTIAAAIPGIVEKLTQNAGAAAQGGKADDLLSSLPGGLGDKLGGFLKF